MAIRVVRPRGNRDMLPAAMFFHGGGWVFGDAHTHDRLVREIANGAAVAVVFGKEWTILVRKRAGNCCSGWRGKI